MPSLEQIQAKLKKLQAQADVLIARKAQAAVDQIRELMLKHGLTTADIEAQAKARRVARGLNGNAGTGRGRPAGASKAAKSATPAKYRDPKTGATWTGHGRAPGWIAGAKDRTVFLIDAASASKAAATPVSKRGKGQPKGAQPPKYLDPKTGATWSGRGPAPAWLASVKDRSKFLIDGASAAAAPKAAAKSGQAKATASAVGKKITAKKAVAKKATRKTAVKKTAAKKATPASRKAAVKKTAGRKSAVKIARKAPARKASAKSTAAPVAAAPQTPETQAGA
ncbi:H-NS histone family protein [Paraburkholderia sp. CNPSo 3155]|uniref:DNA-binding protein H-NS n=1 Tax=Paraburkholderia atlantica TaxID=2654982 RepID=A0A6I1PVF3_PARAM|nr:H-NS family nucleoid-associated regulatory protein [Paraburkholderia atlantica]MBB5418080.1 DNA-binding protein H-NS [Paraburkholderia atlantica]MBB5422472.1 DNA-binding protein H-NS [Paraburkholderia atlantica]MPW05591.1 H-NS histone family protein [Paraburkholderia atlantica]